MTEAEFRVMHSEIIAYYQYIEMHLKGICAALFSDTERNWYDLLKDYESDPLGKLLREIKQFQISHRTALFSSADFESLDSLRESRNYWIHHCFTGSAPIVFRRGVVKNPEFSIKLQADLRDAIDWEARITEVERSALL